MNSGGTLRVLVACALPDRQRVVSLDLPAGTTARQAVLAAGLAVEFPAVDFAACDLGIYGRLVPGEQPLRDGDRVEVYRPLAQDPREARRQAVARGQVMGGRGVSKPPGGDPS